MTSTLRPVPRANLARRQDVPGTRVGYTPTPAPAVDYWPDKGTALARRLIARRPHAALAARKRAAEWLATHPDPRTAPGLVVVANYWATLNAEVEPHGEMAWFLRYNH